MLFRSGLLASPSIIGNSGPTLATDSIYNTTKQFLLSTNYGNIYTSDEIVQQFDDSGNLVFTGTVLTYNKTSSILQVINSSGNYLIGKSIKGTTSGAYATVFSVTEPTLIPFSGYILYIENRVGVQRSDDGIEQFKFVLGF